ncbi:MAG: hypothetical protein Q7S38_00165 [bacterium]|nr:hypothetical protein [bacterium]
MCYNCGCGIPNDDMGRGKISEGGASLTEDDFKLMAKKWGMTVEEAKKHTFELLKKELHKD